MERKLKLIKNISLLNNDLAWKIIFYRWLSRSIEFSINILGYARIVNQVDEFEYNELRKYQKLHNIDIDVATPITQRVLEFTDIYC